jgi:anti-sigma B factor antagonist
MTLESREVGRVTIVRCGGRIVAGAETESLSAHLTNLLRHCKTIVLNLGDVEFVDSSGLGTMVRALTSARQMRGDVKLCNVPESTYKILKMTHLVKLFDICATEEKAIESCHHLTGSWEKLKTTGPSILCIERSPDVLAYLRELLRRAGYVAYTAGSLQDCLLVMRLTPPDLLLMGAELSASPETQQAFDLASAKVPVVELEREFCSQDAGEAATALLERIAARLNSTAN